MLGKILLVVFVVFAGFAGYAKIKVEKQQNIDNYQKQVNILTDFERSMRKTLPNNCKNPEKYGCKGPGAVERKCIELLKNVKEAKNKL